MKRELLTAALFTMVSMGVAWAEGTNKPAEAAKPAGPPPKIQFDKTVYDFGVTSFVESVTGTFSFSNAGEGDLKVGAPKPSCGCTVASVKPDSLKPGEKGELVFKVNVGTAHGALEKHITVPSNDPQAPSINLAIKVDVKQVIEITPTAVSLGSIQQGASASGSVTILRLDGKKLVLGKVETANKMLHARVEPVEGTNADQAAKVVIELKGDGAPARLNENVKVFAEGISQSIGSIYVTGQVLGDVTIDHESLYWSVMDPARVPANSPPAQQVRRVTITSTRSDRALEIKNVASSLKDLTVELSTIETGKVYAVIATLDGKPEKSEQGTVSFDTNMPSQPKITIPVTVVVMGAR
jgi:hypothetical protein